MTTDHIAPCPSCNDDDNEEGAIYDHGLEGVRLQCDCGCCGPYGLDLDEARELWNRLAAQYQRGETDGLCKAAWLACADCDRSRTPNSKVQPATIKDAKWVHPITGGKVNRFCRAGLIRDEINDIEKARP